eukprot:gnl/TRDRNA2_/TRDRNA2_127914_c0_seq1.p1 gnl/TRDRNA2_/TRDRNA2_127914_c0~~gnl/TRDRNA2_/TRDRNA2_127914_c0_seq1.p1  ORF type:complete len:193 (-),score=24.84 gnl/TRDRNA2_/TRDRNA2_127914_c0_seq1:116-610(-)
MLGPDPEALASLWGGMAPPQQQQPIGHTTNHMQGRAAQSLAWWQTPEHSPRGDNTELQGATARSQLDATQLFAMHAAPPNGMFLRPPPLSRTDMGAADGVGRMHPGSAMPMPGWGGMPPWVPDSTYPESPMAQSAKGWHERLMDQGMMGVPCGVDNAGEMLRGY